VARLAPKKAPGNSIRAFKKVLDAFPDATLTMVGAKEELYNECLALTRALNLTDKVIFTGRKTPEEIVSLLHRSRAFVQHSVVAPGGDSEGTPNAILEASACGLPVVSTLHGGIKEAVIHGQTGYLVEEDDIEGMAGYMSKLAGDPALALQLGKNGRRHMMENYTMEKQIRNLYHILSTKGSTGI
jgi:glycosyltransferase involved in cell wall biosynthesis